MKRTVLLAFILSPLVHANNIASPIETYVLAEQLSSGELKLSEDDMRDLQNNFKLEVKACELKTGNPRVVYAEGTDFESSDGTCELKASFKALQSLTTLQLDYDTFVDVSALGGVSFQKCKKEFPFSIDYIDEIKACSTKLVEQELRKLYSH
ncbi:hypothetical protein ACGRSR_05115 [Vibrio owensii]|uniref:hypothetical protein n=1 Tax=Vibrio owensii TaxID=696485 RepID=UPI00374843E1